MRVPQGEMIVCRDLDIGWLQVTVDDAFLVRGLKRLGHLPADAQ